MIATTTGALGLGKYYLSGGWLRWSSYIDWLHNEISEWKPPCQEIVLMGASSGIEIPKQWLSGFDRVWVAQEGDFSRRSFSLRGHQFSEWFNDFSTPLDQMWSDYFLKKHPKAAIVFCDVFSQVASEFENEMYFELWQRKLLADLEGRHWLSFHHLFASGQKPKKGVGDISFPNPKQSIEEIAKSFYEKPRQLSIADFLSWPLAKHAGLERRIFPWRESLGEYSFMEVLRSDRVAAKSLKRD